MALVGYVCPLVYVDNIVLESKRVASVGTDKSLIIKKAQDYKLCL